jgi:hypothetical protein
MTTRYTLFCLVALSLALAACGPDRAEPAPVAPATSPVVATPAPPAPLDLPVADEPAGLAVVPVEDDGPEVEEEPKATRVRIVDSAIASGVEKRVPTGLADVFGTDAGTVWAWVAVENLGEPTKITMVWRRDDKVRSTLELSVGTSPRWRTWSRNHIRKFDAGEWTVDLYDTDGNLLDTLEFTVRDTGDVG